MIEIRFHGRGGQGTVVASEILASAFFRGGFHVQAFALFQEEGMGRQEVRRRQALGGRRRWWSLMDWLDSFYEFAGSSHPIGSLVFVIIVIPVIKPAAVIKDKPLLPD